MTKRFSLLLLVIFFSLFLAFTANAAGIVPCATTENPAPCTLCHFIIGFWKLIDYGFKIFVFVALAGLVIAGLVYIFSAGNEGMMETAKNFIKHILFGFGIILAAWLLIYVVMTYFAVKSDLGIGKTAWNKFECETKSSAGTLAPGSGGGSPLRYSCDRVDVNGNGTIDIGEGACNSVSNGTFSSLVECERNCPVAPSSRCGSNNEGLCTNGLFCPPTTTRIDGNCEGNQVCCRPNL
ncbi:MAG: pilin [Candidatus Moranbacteria bacterium]|nr:pilin [Candidatus Moranbacteria bacterium]